MTKQVNTTNPFTEETLAQYTLLTEDHANECIDNAHRCFESWKLRPVKERAELAIKLADVIEDNKDSLMTLMTNEMGKVKAQGEQEVTLCASICRYVADIAENDLADEKRQFEQGYAYVTYRPTGVILGIQPWNFPLYQVIRYSITNIVAGNTTVMKHASNVFGMAEKIQSMYEQAGFPDNCYQSLLIDGETASKMIAHDKITGVTFTGSDDIGKSVAAEAAKYAKKSVLELGSNDAYMVLDDADIESAVEACVKGRVINNGETCVSAKRFIVTKKNYEDFKRGFVEAMGALKIGDPNEETTDLGPMAREDLRDELHNQVIDSINKGAEVLLGCEIPNRKGFSINLQF